MNQKRVGIYQDMVGVQALNGEVVDGLLHDAVRVDGRDLDPHPGRGLKPTPWLQIDRVSPPPVRNPEGVVVRGGHRGRVTRTVVHGHIDQGLLAPTGDEMGDLARTLFPRLRVSGQYPVTDLDQLDGLGRAIC